MADVHGEMLTSDLMEHINAFFSDTTDHTEVCINILNGLGTVTSGDISIATFETFFVKVDEFDLTLEQFLLKVQCFYKVIKEKFVLNRSDECDSKNVLDYDGIFFSLLRTQNFRRMYSQFIALNYDKNMPFLQTFANHYKILKEEKIGQHCDYIKLCRSTMHNPIKDLFAYDTLTNGIVYELIANLETEGFSFTDINNNINILFQGMDFSRQDLKKRYTSIVHKKTKIMKNGPKKGPISL